jgi:hypothetical protein
MGTTMNRMKEIRDLNLHLEVMQTREIKKHILRIIEETGSVKNDFLLSKLASKFKEGDIKKGVRVLLQDGIIGFDKKLRLEIKVPINWDDWK